MKNKTDEQYVMTPEEWREFETDFAIAVEMMGQSLAGQTPSYNKARRSVIAEQEDMARSRSNLSVHELIANEFGKGE
jgi:hypothetical protein